MVGVKCNKHPEKHATLGGMLTALKNRNTLIVVVTWCELDVTDDDCLALDKRE